MATAPLTKEQKQVIALAAILTVAALYALWMFVLQPALKTLGESRNELEELRRKIEQAERTLQHRAELEKQLAEVAGELRRNDELFIPPLENTLSWATEFVNRHARAVGVSIERVDDWRPGPPPWGAGDKTPRFFVPYAVRVTTSTGFFDCLRLFAAMEKSNPYLYVSEISISATQDPLVQNVQFIVEWPIWKDAAGASVIKDLKKKPAAAAAPSEATRDEGGKN